MTPAKRKLALTIMRERECLEFYLKESEKQLNKIISASRARMYAKDRADLVKKRREEEYSITMQKRKLERLTNKKIAQKVKVEVKHVDSLKLAPVVDVWANR